MYTIYTITNRSNGRVYVGMTSAYDRRKSIHRSDLLANRHSCKELQSDYNKYDALLYEVVADGFCKTAAMDREERLIKALANPYNTQHNRGASDPIGPEYAPMDRLPELITMYGWKKSDIAKLCDVSPAQLTNWTRRKNRNRVPYKHLRTIADYYNLDVRDMYKGTTEGAEIYYPPHLRKLKGRPTQQN